MELAGLALTLLGTVAGVVSAYFGWVPIRDAWARRRTSRSAAGAAAHVEVLPGKITPARLIKNRRSRIRITSTAVSSLLLFSAGFAVNHFWPKASISGAQGCRDRQTGNRVVIGVDLPFAGESQQTSDDTVRAMELYLEDIDYEIAGCKIALKRYNNAAGGAKRWDKRNCYENAQEHVATADEIAVVGPYNSGCAEAQIGVLNRDGSGPMLMISHSNTYPGLTKSWEPDEPEKYYPQGKRNYARIVTTDDYQGKAGVRLAKEIGARSCYVLDDGETYGSGVADRFVETAQANGLEIAGSDSWDSSDKSYAALFQQIRAADPDCIYLGGIFDRNGKQLIRDKVNYLGLNSIIKLIAADGFSGYADLQQMSESEGMYLTFAGMDLSRIHATSAKASKLMADFEKRYGRQPSGTYVLYGVQALQVVLAAIERSDATRRGVRDAFFAEPGIAIKKADSIIGRSLSFDTSTGDVNQKDITVLQMRNGSEEYVKIIDGS
ncbi:branched-chain amino acid ABC transporter substrate-binding protein [Nonomuraea sp. MTCD27]|uniref:branched-chain amino acid ABC transporter substrate-binding protein n=1 Tax=Nonomuraea sp. MTCD27 TaxID=1676747 RepID=UPI0035C184CF